MNDDQLHSLFKKLRDDDTRQEPAFGALVTTNQRKPPPREPAVRVWRWPFGLAATAAAAAIVFFATHASKQSETAPRSAAITPAETADGWTTPSDGLINEYPARRTNTSVGHLIEEIDQILKS